MKQDLKIGSEYPIKGEETYIYQMASDLVQQLEKMYAPGETRRQAHPKMHALLKGEFVIEPNLRQDLKVGVFKQEKSFPCWIRLSNASTEIQDDVKKDVRGFAVKLLDVPGEKLITRETGDQTQDFLLVSMPTFPIGNVHQFQKLLAITSSGKLGKLVLPQNWSSLRTAMRFKKSFVRTSNLLQIPYWSTVPFQFGDVSRAVKYQVLPQSNKVDPMPKNPKSWYLREAIEKTVGASEVNLDFLIQFQEDPKKMPIENAQIEWKSPFIKVATIRIPKQVFAFQDRDIYGQNLDFSPWHSLPAHRPLGGLNRARRIIYHSMAAYRKRRNGVVVEGQESQL